MDYRTFDQWSNAGYKIRKGSKAAWINGVPMFSENQVDWIPPRRSYTPTKKNSQLWWDEGENDEHRYDPWMGGYF